MSPKGYLTSQDLDDIKKDIEKDPKVKLEWITTETKQLPEDHNGKMIHPDDLMVYELIDVRNMKDKGRYYKLMQFKNLHKSITLQNAHVIFKQQYAGVKGYHEAVRYDIISEKQAHKLYLKPKDYEFTHNDFRRFKFKNRAKLMSKRGKRTAVNNLKFGRVYHIDQRIEFGDMPPQSSIYMVNHSLGDNTFLGHNVNFGGDCEDPDWDKNNNTYKKQKGDKKT